VGFKPKNISTPRYRVKTSFPLITYPRRKRSGRKVGGSFRRCAGLVQLWIPIPRSFAGRFCFPGDRWTLIARVLEFSTVWTGAAAGMKAWLLWNKRGIFDPAHFAGNFNEVLRRRVLAVRQQAGRPWIKSPKKFASGTLIPKSFRGLSLEDRGYRYLRPSCAFSTIERRMWWLPRQSRRR